MPERYWVRIARLIILPGALPIMFTEFAVTGTAYRLYHAYLRANRIYTWLGTFFLGVS